MSAVSLWQGRLWSAARQIINLGTYSAQVRRAARLEPGDRVVDIGCGTGEMAPVVPRECSYLGVDLSPENVRRARELHGSPVREFIEHDVTRDPLPRGPYDVALMISVLHHLDDATAESILAQLAPQITKRLVVLDLLAVEGNALQRLLVAFDQGKHPRTLWVQKAILERHFDVVVGDLFATRSGSATHSLFVCEPRK